MVEMRERGEKQFLSSLLLQLHTSSCFVNGFGHDASIIDLGLEKNIAFKIDRAPTPVALRHGWTDYSVWGRLAVVANLSDIAVAGAVPRGFMLAVTVPPEIDERYVHQIIRGAEQACLENDVAFVGGDTKAGTSINVVGACVGTVGRGEDIGRKLANPGDLLVIGGSLGEWLGAYRLQRSGIRAAQGSRSYIDVLSFPTPKIEEAYYIFQHTRPTASCDLSDGLADALNHFCSPNIGVTISEEALPLHQFAIEAARLCGDNSINYAFGVGDWAVSFVIPRRYVEEIHRAKERGLKLTIIGEFNNTGQKNIERITGKIEDTPSFVNEQFRARLEDEAEYLSFFRRS